MQASNPLDVVASLRFELLDYDDLLNLLTDLNQHGTEADKRGDTAECKRTEDAIEAVHWHISDMWLAEECAAETASTMH